jgi:hypothetical protein
MLVIDQLSGEKGNGMGMDPAFQKMGHPLLEQGGFADLAAAADRVNAGHLIRQPKDQGKLPYQA